MSLHLGIILIVIACLMLIWHGFHWRARKNDPALDDFDRRYLYRFFRRRLLAAAILLTIGVLIPLGSRYISWETPQAFVIFWSAVTGLIVWMLLLRLLNVFAARQYSQQRMSRLRQHQLDLARQLEDLQRSLAGRHASIAFSHSAKLP